MFKNFSRNTNAAPIAFNRAQVANLAEPASEPLFPQPTPEDRELIKRLELKSRLHEALLDRLNFAVIEKVEKEALRKEVQQDVAPGAVPRGGVVCAAGEAGLCRGQVRSGCRERALQGFVHPPHQRVHELRRRGARLGCVSMCAGGGMGMAMVVEVV